jgi:hypothetical protein
MVISRTWRLPGNAVQHEAFTRLFAKFARIAPLVILPILSFLILSILVASFSDIPFRNFSRDPLQITGGRFFYGYLSQVGCLLWCAAAVVSFFTGVLLAHKGSSGEEARFFFWGGAMTTLLLFDDMFMLHDGMFLAYLHLKESYTYII